MQAPYKIAALGTSLTARGAWADRLPMALESLTSRPARLIKFARPGGNSRWGLEAARQAAAEYPAIVLIEFAINDAAIHRGVSVPESARNLKHIVTLLRSVPIAAEIYLMTMNPAFGLRGVMRPRLNRYYDIHETIAATERVHLIDIRQEWNALSAADLARAIPDGCHPTAEASLSITLPSIAKAIGATSATLQR